MRKSKTIISFLFMIVLTLTQLLNITFPEEPSIQPSYYSFPTDNYVITPNFAVLSAKIINQTQIVNNETQPIENETQPIENETQQDILNPEENSYYSENETYNLTSVYSPNFYVMFYNVKENLTNNFNISTTYNVYSPNFYTMFKDVQNSFVDKNITNSYNEYYQNFYLLFKDVQNSFIDKNITNSYNLYSPNLYVVFKDVQDSFVDKNITISYNEYYQNFYLMFLIKVSKVILSYKYKVNTSSNTIYLNVTTYPVVPSNAKIVIKWGDGNENITENVEPQTTFSYEHEYNEYKHYVVYILGYSGDELVDNYSFEINTQHFGKGYLYYSYQTDADLNTQITLTNKIELFTDRIDKLNATFNYKILDNESNVLLENTLELTNLTKEGYNFTKTFTINMTFLNEGNYTFVFNETASYPDAINNPFFFNGSFNLQIKANTQTSTNENTSNTNGQIIGGGGFGDVVYNGSYFVNTGELVPYSGINLTAINYSTLTNPQNNLLGGGISYFIQEALPNFLKIFLIIGTTWEGLGALLSAIIFFLRRNGLETLYFIAVWEFIGFIIAKLGMMPLKISSITMNIGSIVIGFVIISLIAYLIIKYLSSSE